MTSRLKHGFNAFIIALMINLYRYSTINLAIEWYLVFLLAVIIPFVSIIPVYDLNSRSQRRPARTRHYL
jgi:hypothetical protein